MAQLALFRSPRAVVILSTGLVKSASRQTLHHLCSACKLPMAAATACACLPSGRAQLRPGSSERPAPASAQQIGSRRQPSAAAARRAQRRANTPLRQLAAVMETQAAAGTAAAAAANGTAEVRTHLCTSLVATTVDGMLAEAQEAVANGADIVELRLDYLEGFAPERDLPRLVQQCPLPAIATYRPVWEG